MRDHQKKKTKRGKKEKKKEERVCFPGTCRGEKYGFMEAWRLFLWNLAASCEASANEAPPICQHETLISSVRGKRHLERLASCILQFLSFPPVKLTSTLPSSSTLDCHVPPAQGRFRHLAGPQHSRHSSIIVVADLRHAAGLQKCGFVRSMASQHRLGPRSKPRDRCCQAFQSSQRRFPKTSTMLGSSNQHTVLHCRQRATSTSTTPASSFRHPSGSLGSRPNLHHLDSLPAQPPCCNATTPLASLHHPAVRWPGVAPRPALTPATQQPASVQQPTDHHHFKLLRQVAGVSLSLSVWGP